MNMTQTTTIVLGSALLLGGLSTGGCSTDDNLRLALGDEITFASLPPRVPEPMLAEDGSPIERPMLTADEPSVFGMDRSEFVPVDFLVPIDGTRHQPEATQPLQLTDETARQRGEFPTAASALETGTDRSRQDQMVELIAEPLVAAVEVIKMPFALIIDPFFETVASPDELPHRSPASSTGNPGLLPLTADELESMRSSGGPVAAGARG